jgi:hypothetical protein
MLERSNGKELIEDVWESTSAKVRLPERLKEQFFVPRGPVPLFYDNKRSYHRYHARSKVLLKRGETTLGGYTVDLSRQGVGFLSPLPLLPQERVELCLPTVELSLEVTRCRRLDEACFICGARFVNLAGRV